MQDVQGIQGLMAGDSGAVDSTYGGEVGAVPVPVRTGRRGLTIRLRMTIAYGAAVFLTGAVLIVTAYFLFRWRLSHMNQDLADPPGCPVLEPKEAPVQAAYCNSAKNKQILNQIDKPLVFVLLISAVVAVLIGYFLAGRFLRPINQITRTAGRVASRPDRALHARIDMEGPQDDELVTLAQTFDGMLDRLDHAFEGQRRFVGNASHELRTPLAINRTLLEVDADGPGGPRADPAAVPDPAGHQRAQRAHDRGPAAAGEGGQRADQPRGHRPGGGGLPLGDAVRDGGGRAAGRDPHLAAAGQRLRRRHPASSASR